MKKFLVIVLLLVYETILFVGCSKESTYQPTELENVSINRNIVFVANFPFLE